jgi:hypothetical protein
MMTRWRSFARESSLGSSALVSVLTHVLLIGSAVVATANSAVEMMDQIPENSIARFLAPPDRSAGQQAQREMIRYVALGSPEGYVPVDVPQIVVPRVAEVLSGIEKNDAPALAELPGRDSVFTKVDVDSAAERYAWSAAPGFPASMLRQNLPGFVRAEWVVDEEGYADTTSLRVLESTHADFTKAVRDALPYMRFRPAKIGTKAVRQRVQQEFIFRIAPPADTTQVGQRVS